MNVRVITFQFADSPSSYTANEGYAVDEDNPASWSVGVAPNGNYDFILRHQ